MEQTVLPEHLHNKRAFFGHKFAWHTFPAAVRRAAPGSLDAIFTTPCIACQTGNYRALWNAAYRQFLVFENNRVIPYLCA
jgi:hypothetical protein